MKIRTHTTTILTALTLTLAAPATAQHTLTGTVVGEHDESLPGAIVTLKGDATTAVTTDDDGRFALTLPHDDACTLTASYVGYVTRDCRIERGDSVVTIRLTEDAIGLETVVVTGTRTPKLLKDAPIITRIITQDDIRKSDATHIGDLLEQELPGLEFNYALSQEVMLNMQGFGGNTVLFLVDGERLAGETMDNVDYTRLSLDDVGRVEIVKGAASSLYGSNAMGGVVNLISSVPDEGWTGHVSGRIGTHGEQRYNATAAFRAGKVANTISIRHTAADQINLKRDGDISRIYGGRTWNAKERLVYEPVDGLTLTARAGYFFRERDYSAEEKNRYRDFSAGLKARWQIAQSDDIELSYQFDQYDKSDYYPTTTRYDIKDYSNVKHAVRTLYNHSFGDETRLTVGADVERDYLLSYQFADNGDYHQYTAAAFAQYDRKVSEHLDVLVGMRYDYYSEASVNHVSPKLSAMYRLGAFTLRGSYAGGFRAPTVKEMYTDYDVAGLFTLYGNADLKAESSHNFLLSGEWTRGRYSANVSGYYNLVDERITSMWNNELHGMYYYNMSAMRIYGFEVNAAAHHPWGFSFRLSYCYNHERARQGETYRSYAASARPHTATVRFEYGRTWSRYAFDVALSGRLLSAVDTIEYTAYEEDESGTAPTEAVHYPGYALWKLVLTQRVLKGVTVTATVDNLFDYVPGYYYTNSPMTTGRTLAVGVSIDIDKLF